MGRWVFLTGLALICAARATPQAVTEWATHRGVPVSVIEIPGGDVVHAAAVISGDTALPAAVAGFPVEVRPFPPGLVATVTVPALTAVAALQELAAVLAASGAAAVVVVGGAPARELGGAVAALDAVPHVPLARRPCLLAQGNVSVVRGSPERVEVNLLMPGPEDPRFDLLPALEEWVRRRLATRWPGVGTSLDRIDPCPRLVIRLPSPLDPPHTLLAPLRESLRRLAVATPTADEVLVVSSILDRRRASWAVDGRGAARELATRRALGGRVASALSPPFLDAEALGALASALLGGQAGDAVLVERERRPVGEAPAVLDNGVALTWRWVPSAVGTVGVALGGVEPEVGVALLQELATEAAGEGWPAVLDVVAGVPALALAVPADDLPGALELVASGLLNPRPAGELTWREHLGAALGLGREISGETVSVAVSAPAEAEVVREAAEKFFSGLPAGGVHLSEPLSPGLTTIAAEGVATVMAAVPVLPGVAGWLAGEVLASRLQRQAGASTRWLAPPGRLVLEVTKTGEGHVPGVDAALAGFWPAARAPATPKEIAAAASQLRALLYGDPARAALRAAASRFLHTLIPRQEELLAVEVEEVSKAMAAIPSWEEIRRLGHGPEPLRVAPPPRPAVRQSPARRPGG